MRALLLVACLASPAAAEAVKDPTCGDADPKAPAPRSVRDVDWCNSSAGTWKGVMRRGHADVHLYRSMGKPHDTISTRLRGVVYGDLEGDGKLEAAVVIEKSTWIDGAAKSSRSMTVYIYGFASGAHTLIGTLPTGAPVRDIAFAKGVITVSSGDPAVNTSYRFDAATKAFVVAP